MGYVTIWYETRGNYHIVNVNMDGNMRTLRFPTKLEAMEMVSKLADYGKLRSIVA